MIKVHKIRKMKRDSVAYKKEEIEIALEYCPPIYPCCECGHPVIEGYCCTTCMSMSPEDYKKLEENNEKDTTKRASTNA